MEARRLTVQDWALLREVTTQALAEAPDAFWSTHVDGATFDDDHWRRLCRAAAWWLVICDGHVIGVAAGLGRAEAPDEPELMSVWVDPSARRWGAASLLVRAALEWATAGDASTMTLWITDDNTAARQLGERLGFKPTGERCALPHRGLTIERMRIVLPGGCYNVASGTPSASLTRALDGSAGSREVRKRCRRGEIDGTGRAGCGPHSRWRP